MTTCMDRISDKTGNLVDEMEGFTSFLRGQYATFNDLRTELVNRINADLDASPSLKTAFINGLDQGGVEDVYDTTDGLQRLSEYSLSFSETASKNLSKTYLSGLLVSVQNIKAQNPGMTTADVFYQHKDFAGKSAIVSKVVSRFAIVTALMKAGDEIYDSPHPDLALIKVGAELGSVAGAGAFVNVTCPT